MKEPTRDRTRRAVRPRRPLYLSGAGLLAWASFIHGIVPLLIRVAYDGRGPALLNRMISGQAVHSVQHYLAVWNGLAWKLDLVALLALFLWVPGSPGRNVVVRLLRAEPVAGAGELLSTAAFWGIATGVAEGLHVLLRKSITPINAATFNQSMEAVWLVPIAELPFFLAVGLVLVLAMRAWRRPVSFRLVTVLFAFLGAYVLMRSARLGINVWAIRLLALGIAVQAARWITPRSKIFRRRLPRLIAAGAAWTILSATVLHGGRAAREWWKIRDLPAAGEGAPDVLLLILDTVRAHSLSLYGHEHPTTPRLDEIAGDALVFDAAIAPASWTLPSHASLLTGQEPWNLSTGWMEPLDDAQPVLAEALAARGYATGAFVANRFYAGRDAGIARGFAHFEEEGLSFNWAIQNSWLTRNVVSFVRSRLHLGPPSAEMHAGDVSDRFLRWTAGLSGRPFFAMLNYMDAHAPYEAPDSIVARFTSGTPMKEPAAGVVYTPGELEQFRSAYDAAVAYIDQEIGRIVDTLQARGQLERTVLIVTSDHGEHIGERDPGLHLHGNSLYAATIRVPLLIRYPAGVPAGRRIDRAVGIRRIAASVMELVGDGAHFFPGPALAVELDSATVPEEAPVVSFLRPGFATLSSEPLAAGPMASVAWKQWHYIRNGNGEEELYDMEADPWEVNDRAGDPGLAPVLERLRREARVLEPFGVPARR